MKCCRDLGGAMTLEEIDGAEVGLAGVGVAPGQMEVMWDASSKANGAEGDVDAIFHHVYYYKN